MTLTQDTTPQTRGRLDAELADVPVPAGATACAWEDDCGEVSRTLHWFEASIASPTYHGGAYVAAISYQTPDGPIGSPSIDMSVDWDSPTPDQARRLGEALMQAAEVAERVMTGQSRTTMAILAAVREGIERAGVGHDNLAARIGMEPDRLARKLTDRAPLTVAELVRIATAIGCRASELMGDLGLSGGAR